MIEIILDRFDGDGELDEFVVVGQFISIGELDELGGYKATAERVSVLYCWCGCWVIAGLTSCQ